MVTRDIIQRLLGIINDTRARVNTLESREVALLTATQTLTNKTLTTPTIGNFTNAQHAHTDATSGGTISHGSLTDLTTGDPHTQYLLETTYDANTILKADADNTPIALTVDASTIVGRASTGNIAALTAAQVATIVQSSIDHSSLTNLTTGDPHTQYLLETTYDANTILKADADNTPIALTVDASTIVGRASTGNIAALTAAQVATIVQSSIDHSSLTNLTTGDPHTQYLLETTYDANTILKADADNTPIALTVGASTIVGRASTGDIAALTAAQVATIVQSSIDHGSIVGLTDDDHTGYARLAGRSGGQTLIGGTAANDDLTLEGTSNATRTTSYVILQPTAGNVGIGTASPTLAKLDVNQFSSISPGSAIKFGVQGFLVSPDTIISHNGYWTGSAWANVSNATSAQLSLSGDIIFRTAVATAGAPNWEPRLTILNSNGNVGIGTTSPGKTLHVAGSAKIGSGTSVIGTLLTISGESYNQVNITHGSSNDWGLLLGYGDGAITGNYHGNNHAAIINVQNAPLHLGANNNAIITILGDGKVGIGTTSPSRKFHVAGTILIDGDESGIAGTIGLTYVNDATLSTGNGTVKLKGTTARDSAGFIKIYVGTTTAWIPYWTNIS